MADPVEPLSISEWVDEIADQYEEAWRGVQPPCLEDFLGDSTDERRAALLAELMQIDQAYRAKVGRAESHQLSTVTADFASTTPFPEKPFPPPPGKDWPSIPGYEILDEVGQGGMGVVYKARQIALKRVVALKMISAKIRAGERERSRFRAEMEAVARLRHPNIIQIYEVGEYDGRPYCALEYVEGGLDKKLTGTPLHARQAAQLVEILAHAVHHAHQNGIVHRDLKPANILLTGESRVASSEPATTHSSLATHHSPLGTPKITDFGLAKHLGSDAGQTQSGEILGTPSYMAPEQAEGKSNIIGPRADVYALGAILYELLTGRPPFRGETLLDTLEQVRSQEPVPPSQLQPKLPRDLSTICLKAMAKVPARRYATAGDLANDLRRFLDGKPILARSVSRAEKLWRWCRRNRVLAVVSGLATAALSLTVATLAVAFILVSRSRDDALQLAGENSRLAEAERVQRETADQEKKKAQREAALLALERGWNLYDQREGGRGFLWLARGLELAHAADDTPLVATFQANLALAHGQTHVLRTVLPHQASVMQVAFSPDGRTALTASYDWSARLWEVATGRELLSLRHPSEVQSVTFRPDGKAVLTGDTYGHVRLWDVASGRFLGIICSHQGQPSRMLTSLVFSPDGKTLLTGSYDGQARLWDTATWQPRGQPLTHQVYIHSVAFSPDSQTIVTGGDDGVWRLWDAATGALRRHSLRHDDPIWAVAFAPDGQSFLTGGGDGRVQRWNAATGERVGQPLVHQGAVLAVAISPDGQTVLTGSTTARLWAAATGEPLLNPLAHQGSVSSVCFGPDGQTVLTGSQDDHCARLWEVSQSQPRPLLLPHTEWVGAVAFSPDSNTVLTGCWDGTARLWDAATGKPCGEPLRHPDSVSAVAFSPDGRTFVTGTGPRALDTTARLWDVATQQPTGVRVTHTQTIHAVAFRPDGKAFLTASKDQSAVLWDAASGQCRLRLPHATAVLAVAFSPDGQRVVTGSQDNQARLWDAATGQLIGKPLHHHGPVQAAAFSPDGRLILTGSVGATARLWDTATGQPRGTPFSTQGAVTAVAFSPDGRTILTGSYDGNAQLWDAATGQRRGQPFAHPRAVRAAAFSPDGRKILTGSEDHNARLWDVPGPVTGSPEQILLWAQTITGLELDRRGGLSVLGARDWEERRQLLWQFGGVPLPR